jgi:hypothetical protein
MGNRPVYRSFWLWGIIASGVLLIIFSYRHNLHWYAYLEGYWIGHSDARNDIANGHANIIYVGEELDSKIDPETGLLLRSLGCIANSGTDGYLEGYNHTIQSWIKENGPPAYSWKPWEEIVFNLTSYFDRRSSQESPAILRIEGSGIKGPNSNSIITLKPNNTNKQYYRLCISGTSNNCDTVVPFPLENGELKILFGPQGSNLVIVRGVSSRLKARMGTGAFDLKREKWLRSEYRD